MTFITSAIVPRKHSPKKVFASKKPLVQDFWWWEFSDKVNPTSEEMASTNEIIQHLRIMRNNELHGLNHITGEYEPVNRFKSLRYKNKVITYAAIVFAILNRTYIAQGARYAFVVDPYNPGKNTLDKYLVRENVYAQYKDRLSSSPYTYVTYNGKKYTAVIEHDGEKFTKRSKHLWHVLRELYNFCERKGCLDRLNFGKSSKQDIEYRYMPPIVFPDVPPVAESKPYISQVSEKTEYNHVRRRIHSGTYFASMTIDYETKVIGVYKSKEKTLKKLYTFCEENGLLHKLNFDKDLKINEDWKPSNEKI